MRYAVVLPDHNCSCSWMTAKEFENEEEAEEYIEYKCPDGIIVEL